MLGTVGMAAWQWALPVTTAYLLGTSLPAFAQLQNGQIQGVVTSDADGKPLAGVTVMVSGPALQEPQTEVTGADGRYLITQLPSGDDYLVAFYLGDTVVERPGVRIAQNKTLTISLDMPLKKMTKEVKVIKERAPNVDTANANSGVEINADVLRTTAVRGRTYESALQLAPGTVDAARGQGGDVGVSISGSTGNENNFIIDGLNTSDPNTGIIGTELHQYFVKEINVITGGYQAEYGRATGGVVSIVTKSGSNEFHGSVFGSVQPFQLPAATVGRLGEALALRRLENSLTYDYGFELGGPIVKNRVWFYVGFAPTSTLYRNERAVRRRVLDPMTGRARLLDGYQCPSYLATSLYCRGARSSALATEELPVYGNNYDESKQLYNGIAKLQFNINADHNITIGYIAAPSTFDGYSAFTPFSYSNVSDFRYSSLSNTHDVNARYVGKLLDRKLQIDVMYGYHYQDYDQRPQTADKPTYLYYADAADPYSLADFEPIGECQRSASGFNPCPVAIYRRYGFGRYDRQLLQRHQVLAAATAYLNFLGSHAVKVGFDFEHLRSDHTRTYSGSDIDPNDPSTWSDPTRGHRYFQTSDDGSQLKIFAEYGTRDANGNILRLNSFRAETFTNNYSTYLRDSWNVSVVPGLVINAGLRWEVQQIFGADGSERILIPDNVAPRLGAVWDFTRKGFGKLYANYGRFYQSVPLTINDRQFSGEGIITGLETSDCPRGALQPGGRLLPYAGRLPGAPCSVATSIYDLNAGTYGNVMPGLKGQYLDEVVAGINYDVGWDVVLGLGYIYRDLGNIIEDMSADGGNNYLIANPGVRADPARITELENEVNRLRTSGASQLEVSRAQSRLDSYRSLGRLFPKATRTYHALVLSLNKRLANRVSLIANYTFSRTIGNYPGTYDATTDDNSPNFSAAYDLVDAQDNKNGPLPTDRPHNFKFLGTYSQPLPGGGKLDFGLTFSMYSGRPINVLGAHPIYGSGNIFLLPRGSGGRTPTITQFDAHIGYDQPLPKSLSLSVFVDVINLFNQREVASVDDDYTYSLVAPIRGGGPQDLLRLRTVSGELAVVNSNFGQPTAYQAPLYMRFGARLAF